MQVNKPHLPSCTVVFSILPLHAPLQSVINRGAASFIGDISAPRDKNVFVATGNERKE
jgi:hypothetical protein